MASIISPPGTDEYAEFHKGYMTAVAGETNALDVLTRQLQTIEWLRALTPSQAAHRYAAGKWSVGEVIGHVSDSERVFAYRLLRIARGDQTPLPGFDQDVVAAHSNAATRGIGDLIDELVAVRKATLALVRSLDEAALNRRGSVNNWTLSARALAFIIAGHFQHHATILRDRYSVPV